MNIATKYLGNVEINKENIIFFPDGILGLEEEKEFIILDVPENDRFKIMQSISTQYISFLIVNPWDFYKDYDFEINDTELSKIEISKKEQIAIYNIVTGNKDFSTSTVNLLAPVVININNMIGKQYIANEKKYTTKHTLFKEVGKVNKDVNIK